MPQSVLCHVCAKMILLPDDSAGMRIRCAGCDVIHEIVANDSAALELVGTAAVEEVEEAAVAGPEKPVVVRRGLKAHRRAPPRVRVGSSSSRRRAPRPIMGSSGTSRGMSAESEGTGSLRRRRVVNAPSNHLALAICSLILGFWPFGIVSVVFACRVDSEFARGAEHRARESSRMAKLWAFWSFGVLLVFMAIILASTLSLVQRY